MLTLDAVAAEAGVSKGGFMYHFSSKEALLRALVARAVEAVDRVLASAAQAREPGAFARAYLRTTIPELPIVQAQATAGSDQDHTAVNDAVGDVAREDVDAAPAPDLVAAWLAMLLHLPPLSESVHRQTLGLLMLLTEPPHE